MEELRAIFLNQINNIPFIECIDENQFYDEFINSPKETINEELIINEILNGKNVDEINSDDEKKFNAKVLEIVKTKNQKYYIPNIQKTETYKRLNEIWEVYYNFLKTITGNHKNNNSFVGKSLNIDEKINEPKDVDFDRYKEVKITVSRILQLLNYFDINIQKLIIEILISDSGIKIFLSENNNIYKSVDPLIIHFKEKLSNKFSKIILENSTPEAPQEQNKNKSENVFKYSAKHYVIAYYLDCIAIGSRPISDNLKKQVEEKGVEYTSGKKSGNTFYKSYRKVMSDFDNANDKLVYLSDIFDGDWEARLIEISKQKEIIINFIKSNPFIKNL